MEVTKSMRYASYIVAVLACVFDIVEAGRIARSFSPVVESSPTIHRALHFTGVALSATTPGYTGPINFSSALIIRRDDESVFTETTITFTPMLEISQPTTTETSMTTMTLTQQDSQSTSTGTTAVSRWITVEQQSSESSPISTPEYCTMSCGPSSSDTSEYFTTMFSEPSSTEASVTVEYATATSTTDAPAAINTTTAPNNGSLVLSYNNDWALEPLSTECRKHANWAVGKLVPGLVVPSVIFDGGVYFFFRWMHEIKRRVDLHTGTKFSPDMTDQAYETATRLIFDTEVARRKDLALKSHTNEAAHEAALKLQEEVAREALEFVDTGFRGNHDPLTDEDLAEADQALVKHVPKLRHRGRLWGEELERSINQNTLDSLAGPASKLIPENDPFEPAYPSEPVVEPELAPIPSPGEGAPVAVPPREAAPAVVPPEAEPVVAPDTLGFPSNPFPDITFSGSDEDKDKDQGKDGGKDSKNKNKDGKKKVSFALTTMLTTTKATTSTQESTRTTETTSTSTTSNSTSSTSTSSTSTSSTTTPSTATQQPTQESTPTNSNTPTSHIEVTDTGHKNKYTFSLFGSNWPSGVHKTYLGNELRQCKGKSLDHWTVHSDSEARARGYDFWVEGRIEGKKGFPKSCFQVAVKQVGGVDPWV